MLSSSTSCCDTKTTIDTGESFDVDIDFTLGDPTDPDNLDIIANYTQISCILYIREGTTAKIFGTFALDTGHADLSMDYTWSPLTLTLDATYPTQAGIISVVIPTSATEDLITRGSRDMFASIIFKSPTSLIKTEDILLPNAILVKSISEGLV